MSAPSGYAKALHVAASLLATNGGTPDQFADFDFRFPNTKTVYRLRGRIEVAGARRVIQVLHAESGELVCQSLPNKEGCAPRINSNPTAWNHGEWWSDADRWRA